MYGSLGTHFQERAGRRALGWLSAQFSEAISAPRQETWLRKLNLLPDQPEPLRHRYSFSNRRDRSRHGTGHVIVMAIARAASKSAGKILAIAFINRSRRFNRIHTQNGCEQ
jgi:hypothetical protein